MILKLNSPIDGEYQSTTDRETISKMLHDLASDLLCANCDVTGTLVVDFGGDPYAMTIEATQ